MPLLIYALIVLFTFIILSNIVSWFANNSSSNSVIEGATGNIDDGEETAVKPNASNNNSLEIQTQDNTTNIATNTTNIATNTTNITSLQDQVNQLSTEISNAGTNMAGSSSSSDDDNTSVASTSATT